MTFCFADRTTLPDRAYAEPRGDRTGTGQNWPRWRRVGYCLTNSTRRFSARPVGVLFEATGFEDPRRRVPAIDKAKRLLGFQPKVSLETGLKKTLAWCREHFRH